MKNKSALEEVRKSVASAIAERSPLRIPDEAVRIAGMCGVAPDAIARELVAAATRAQVGTELRRTRNDQRRDSAPHAYSARSARFCPLIH